MSVLVNNNGTLVQQDASAVSQLAAVDTENILGGGAGATTDGQTLVDQLAADVVQAQSDIGALQSDKAEASTIAVIESASTSSAAYSAGDYIYHANALYRVTAPISIGDTFTVGTNIETATVCDEISDIKTDLPNLFPRSEQRVQGAKNHLRNEAYTQTIGVITFTVDADGIIDVDTNGQTTTAAVSIRIYNESSAPELPQGDWILNGCPTGGGSTTYEIYYMERDSAGTGWENVCRDYGDGVSFSRQNDRAYAVVLQIRSGQTFNHLKFKPMIRLSTDTDPTFAPYAMTNRELTATGLTLEAGTNISITRQASYTFSGIGLAVIANILATGDVPVGSTVLSIPSGYVFDSSQDILAVYQDSSVARLYCADNQRTMVLRGNNGLTSGKFIHINGVAKIKKS